MRSAIVACLLFATHLHAETTLSTPLLNIEEELANISTTCLSYPEQEEIAGYTLGYRMAKILNVYLISEAHFLIGRTELRAALGMPPRGPWKRKRNLKEEDILAAPTIEEYYERREESLFFLSLDNGFFLESNFPPAIAFLDKRFPAIRGIYRQEFRNAKKIVDREEVDSMISKFRDVALRIQKAVREMQDETALCWYNNEKEVGNFE
ncbi:hypothetical protein CRE_24491 [Caenorhabditis remanei]|uniref:Uncharacterized protein n=1 Tax=Caenorhabditis remanei TaxID=31234 RepID=E3MFX1_CAERE|nr:hypothetical protein CRE_24491 [Caenorhabditis remanei]